MASVQATVTALQALTKIGYNSRQIQLVVNQIVPYNGLPPDSIQKTLRRSINAVIPFEADMVKAINLGKPLLLLSPQSPASTAIVQLASKLFV